MGAHGGPNMTEDGVVFYYDTGNSKSYAGEPTVNLLYSTGAYNLEDGATDIYGNVTKTDLGNGKYRFVNDGTGATTVRVYANEADLIDGETYAVSVYYEDLIGTVSIDWCDQTVAGNNTSTEPSGRLAGTSSRSSYTSPFYFLDINMTIGGSVTLFDPQVEHKSHVTPFVAGTRSATQGLKDFTKSNTLDISTVSFDSNAQIEFDGSDDYIALPSSLRSIFSAAPNSVELVLKKSSADQSNMVVFDIDITRWNLNYNEYVTGQWSFDFYDGTEHVIAGGNYDNNYVHFVLQQLDDGTMELYANGELKGTEAAGNLAPNGNSIRIGSRSNGDSRYFKGELPMVKIYNRALTAEEVAENFNGIRSRFGI